MKKIFNLLVISFLIVSLGNIIYNSFPEKYYYTEQDIEMYKLGIRYDKQSNKYYYKNIQSGELKETLDQINPFHIKYDLLNIIYGGRSFKFGENQGFNIKNYHPNGEIESKGMGSGYLNTWGVWKYYHTNGQIKFEGFWNNRTPDGVWKIYSNKGKLIEEVEYHNEEWNWVKCWDNNGDEIVCCQ
jgi:antitoxin component YwqK of YwqJK toxin-antitoxin module|tara:strand:- start:368 stop:922 length:555 start_codon:yes stop_codon:yes gene_type:complete